MAGTTFYNSLLHEIENIYFRVSYSLLQKRMHSYHAQAAQGGHYANGIRQPLMGYINDLAAVDHADPTSLRHIDHTAPEHPAHQHIPIKYLPQKHGPNKANVSELSRYFKMRNNEAMIHNGIEEKLEHSTWEHIHAAIRYARQGETKKARMHADIASTACAELAHFMLGEAYTTFVTQIEQYLDVLRETEAQAQEQMLTEAGLSHMPK